MFIHFSQCLISSADKNHESPRISHNGPNQILCPMFEKSPCLFPPSAANEVGSVLEYFALGGEGISKVCH